MTVSYLPALANHNNDTIQGEDQEQLTLKKKRVDKLNASELQS